MYSEERLVVIGAGSFGTAIASLFARNGMNVTILDRNDSRCEFINTKHMNPDYLKGQDLPQNLKATTNAVEAFKDVHFVFHAIPMQSSRDVLLKYVDLIGKDIPIISMTKGIHTETLELMSDIMANVFGKDHPTAYISGPSFAKEIVLGCPTGFSVGSTDINLAKTVAKRLSSDKRVRSWTTTDVVGVEICGALKNVYAIAVGAIHKYGENTSAMLVTKACNELMVLSTSMGAAPATVMGLAGIGDLMLTCLGKASRNKSVGIRLGNGESLQEIIDSMDEVAEGVPTIKAAKRLAEKYGVYKMLPILNATYKLAYENQPLDSLVEEIMLDGGVMEERVLYNVKLRGDKMVLE